MKRHAPAAARNREPIAAVLAEVLPPSGKALEIASGTGEHAVFFAARFPGIELQPSDPDPDSRASIEAHRHDAGLPNLLPPIDLDATAADWPVGKLDAIININMIHISPWEACLGLLSGATARLSPGAPLYLYGPYLRGPGDAPSNLAFDQSLRSRDPRWGVRRLEDVVSAAAERGFELERTLEMPANNLSVIFRRGVSDVGLRSTP
jgi:hypothetical protein